MCLWTDAATLAAKLASAAMTAADAATLKDGDLNHRAMPNLDQGDVDALASAVAPMLAEDDAFARGAVRPRRSFDDAPPSALS